ncbi:sterile alpha motif domain-containing protein 15-like [Gigantopelta aegis]|uniref:sterile alpha motif domain-containing protein 15-like n=1 Tax=Gigantopelta aegis TaxID=1735272 RepID=UPI001B888C6D|nr:sterile alpha motif domain-containing protein 15-like [Gigantopelta aegis]
MAAGSASTSKLEDLKDENVPVALYWSYSQVADWIQDLGFPQYKACFTNNLIDGRRLVMVEASAFPKIGITDFEHIKIISKSIQDLLTLEEPDSTRSISLPPRNNLGMYLEKKSVKGKIIDGMSYQKFLQEHADAKWRPPLSNHCLILPYNTPPGIVVFK